MGESLLARTFSSLGLRQATRLADETLATVDKCPLAAIPYARSDVTGTVTATFSAWWALLAPVEPAMKRSARDPASLLEGGAATLVTTLDSFVAPTPRSSPWH
ncbi:hypothetical protein [Ralstonia sp. 25mfcol4.1]|uniref:hypothetical protein n=1 Tax=Ralstonia sp. 25mfcol4.1 TaxID=1761899 RepID=UPI0011138E26|nr:hypothetical protein [Ralstonia sp. 25mfcol4.1]